VISLRSPWLALAVILPGLLAGCQKSDDHPPFAPACEINCAILPPISVGGGGAGAPSTGGDTDAGTGTLAGKVLLLDDESFASTTVYPERATVTADGANGTPVTAIWDGTTPYLLEGVQRVATSWIRIEPEQSARDPLLTYQAVATNRVTQADVGLVSAATLDRIFNAVSELRSPVSGQVILFFHDDGKRLCVADSVGAWLAAIAADLEAGTYEYDTESNEWSDEALLQSSLEGKDTYG